MFVTVTISGTDQVHSFDIDPHFTVGEFEGIIAAEANINGSNIILVHDGKLMEKSKTLQQCNVKEDDLILLQSKKNDSTAATSRLNDETDIEKVRQHIINDADVRLQLQQKQPNLLNAALNHPNEFYQMMREFRTQMLVREGEHAAALQRLERNPLDVEAQQKIEELIREERIAENMAHAMEYHPESFGSVTMLYIDCRVNGKRLKAFVDCGAQTTISETSFSGIAKGVGTTQIVGRIHLVQLHLGNQFLPCSVTVIDGDGPDMLFGLDMLKRHQCSIDLKRNILIVNDESVPFLLESEIPKTE